MAEEFEKQFTCSAGITKEITKDISYILQLTDSGRFMASSLSNLANNLSEGIHRIKCKFGNKNKKCEACGINFKDGLIEYKCLSCNKNYQRKFDEKLKEPFFNTYKFSNHDNNKFILLL